MRLSRRSTYHVYNRGSRKAKVFFTRRDYEFFWGLLDKWLPYHKIKLISCSLMPNHFHLEPYLVDAKVLSRFMHRIGTIYGLHFKYANGLCGHVFQNKYRRKIIQGSFGMVNLFRYISQNPAELCKSGKWKDKLEYIKTYRWGTYKYFCGYDKNVPKWLDQEALLREFGCSYESFLKFCEYPIRKWEETLLRKALE